MNFWVKWFIWKKENTYLYHSTVAFLSVWDNLAVNSTVWPSSTVLKNKKKELFHRLIEFYGEIQREATIFLWYSKNPIEIEIFHQTYDSLESGSDFRFLNLFGQFHDLDDLRSSFALFVSHNQSVLALVRCRYLLDLEFDSEFSLRRIKWRMKIENLLFS